MPKVLKPVKLSASIAHYVNGLGEGDEFGITALCGLLGRDRQAVEYHLRKMSGVRKSGSKPGVWIRRQH